MLVNLLLGVPVMAICLILQSTLVVLALRFYARSQAHIRGQALWSALRVLTGVMLILILGNLAQVLVWALLFLVLGEFDELATAVYHSAVNFATLGYGDIVMSERHALLGPLEAINGILMVGISTAALMHTFQHALRRVLGEPPA
ncbi:ion channel [Pseudohaliea rubra]|uniref:Kef-type K+ transport system, predicted NAD-binding protein component n=1 Tax=Pseudohaliea rubra DSM 19751 TaxID=1265313 RepID=A0A095VNT4_9GAMM|nr:ion channel [Pseudohaliea rubra]KGE03035.1 Kef-type K+ transport system, predicted NAD-binding protein component [Pseudohaliea rubra DSM 19751]